MLVVKLPLAALVHVGCEPPTGDLVMNSLVGDFGGTARRTEHNWFSKGLMNSLVGFFCGTARRAGTTGFLRV